MVGVANNWLGWGSKDAWLTEHNKSLNTSDTVKPTADPLGKYDTAYNKKYPNEKPTFEQDYQSNQAWYAKMGMLRDQSLVDQGFQHYEGSADATPEQLRAAGYKSQADLGGTAANAANSWYLSPEAKAASTGGGGGGSSGGYSAPAPAAAPKPVEPEPFKLNTATGSAIGGDISATLGSVGKSLYARAAKGLKGLSTPTASVVTFTNKDKDLERKRFGQGLFNVGLTNPGSGTGVQV